MDAWQRRFRTSIIYFFRVAEGRRDRAVVATDRVAADEPRAAEVAVSQLYTVDMSTGEVRALTQRATAIREGWISPDGESVYYLDDDHGDEHGQLVRIPFDGGGDPVPVTDLPAYTLRGVEFSGSGRRLAFNPINADGFQLWCADLDADGVPGQPWRVFASEHETMGAHLDHDGRLAAVQSTDRAGGLRYYATVVYDVDSGARIAELAEDGVSIVPVGFSPLQDDPRLLIGDDSGGFIRPWLWHPHTGERSALLPQEDADVVPVDWSADGRWVLLCRYRRGVGHLLVLDLTTGGTEELTAEGTYHDPLYAPAAFGAGRDVIALHEAADQPPRLVRLTGAGAPPAVLLNGSDADGARSMRSVTFRSADGQELQAWLGVPDGPGPFPTVLEAHGGPHFARLDVFDPFAQALLDHGIAFLTVNYRGSTTFGRAFKEQIWGRIGEAELADVVAARTYLVESGIARPDGVVLTGASYGGFLTLLGLGRHPELWARGMAMVPVADTALCYAQGSDALKGAMTAWFKGTPAQNPDGYASASPVNHVHRVRAPVLILVARHDTRTPPGQTLRYVELLSAYGKEFELYEYDDGHAPPPAALYEKMITFATEAGAR